MITILIFCMLSLPLLALSWRSMFSLKNHGVYRFIVWECILWLSVKNYRYLKVREFDFQQIISSILLIASLVLVLSAVFLMMKRGKANNQRKDNTLFGFEKTTKLVDSGIYGYVRHPMYGSLLLLTWGILLRNIEPPLTIIALISTCSSIIAALIEEKENMNYFGDSYNRYKLKTKMFIPFII